MRDHNAHSIPALWRNEWRICEVLEFIPKISGGHSKQNLKAMGTLIAEINDFETKPFGSINTLHRFKARMPSLSMTTKERWHLRVPLIWMKIGTVRTLPKNKDPIF